MLLHQAEPVPEKGTAEPPFASFVGGEGDMAYLVEPDTYNLICGNKAFYDRIGLSDAECLGLKCYEAMHRRTSPCPFCSKANWSTDKFFLWKNLNGALEQEFLIKNKLVQWQGKEALLALAIDISNDKSIVDSLENGATESHSIISGIQRMTEAPDLVSAMDNALETVGYFFRADAVRFWRRPDPDADYECAFAWRKRPRESDARTDAQDSRAVTAWLRDKKWIRPIMIESREAMLCYSFDMYQGMQRSNIHNQRWVQLRDGETEMGCLSIENISSNFQNEAFLESFSGFIVGELKKRSLMETILYASSHDSWTNLLSRGSYEKYVQDYDPDAQPSLGIMSANLNNLKGINNTKGFQAGDYYIKHCAAMLREVFGQYAVYRLNGDEFLVVAGGPSFEEWQRMVTEFQERAAAVEQFSVSVGAAWDNVEKDFTELLEQASRAMKASKRRFYDSGAVGTDGERRTLLHNLLTALEQREYEVFLQPKIDMLRHKLMGAEALIRCRHKELGLIGPGRFIPVLEKNNLVRYMDLFVFQEVCALLERWGRRGLTCPVLSLNFSRLTLLEPDIVSSMEKIIAAYDVPRRQIEIEITESLADMGKTVLYQAAADLYKAGFAISLDDFGTKYTNLAILADIDFTMLKLDKSLIHSLDKQTNHRIILKNIIGMCRDMHIEVIAEGVETREQEKALRDLGCLLGQGYLYGKPMPVPEFEALYMGGPWEEALPDAVESC